MKLRQLTFTVPVALVPALLIGQAPNRLDPSDLLKPLGKSWPTYSGDYTGKRYSTLDQINQSNVAHLTLAWMTQVTPGARNRFGSPA